MKKAATHNRRLCKSLFHFVVKMMKCRKNAVKLIHKHSVVDVSHSTLIHFRTPQVVVAQFSVESRF